VKVFITGASSGLGEGLARHYARAGAIIGLCARREALLEDLARSVEAAGARAVVHAVDVSDTALMQKAAAAFAAASGGIDLVIANAGIGIASETLLGKSEPIAKLMRVNVIGVTNTIVPFVPIMIQQGSGTLVAMSSEAGHRGLPGRTAYSASKAAVITFMDAIDRRAKTFTFPWQMRILSALMKLAPESILRWMSPPARTAAPD
jgi:hypothetical protein